MRSDNYLKMLKFEENFYGICVFVTTRQVGEVEKKSWVRSKAILRRNFEDHRCLKFEGLISVAELDSVKKSVRFAQKFFKDHRCLKFEGLISVAESVWSD